MSVSLLLFLPSIGLLFVPWQPVLIDSKPNFWETDPAVFYEQRFEVNEPICGFVGVVSLVYTLNDIYASAYTTSQNRIDEIRRALTQEASGVHTMMLLVRTLEADSEENKKQVILLFASYIEQVASKLRSFRSGDSGDYYERSDVETLYAAVPFLAKIADDGEGDNMDRMLVERAIDMLNQVSGARSARETLLNNQHSLIQFIFLGEFCMATCFGVSLMECGSRALNIVLPLVTVTTLISSIYFLADLERPFRGWVVVDTRIFDRIRESIGEVLSAEQEDDATTVWVGAIPATVVEGDDPQEWSQAVASLLRPHVKGPLTSPYCAAISFYLLNFACLSGRCAMRHGAEEVVKGPAAVRKYLRQRSM